MALSESSSRRAVIYVNAAVSLLSAMRVGYSFGVNGRRNLFHVHLAVVHLTGLAVIHRS